MMRDGVKRTGMTTKKETVMGAVQKGDRLSNRPDC